jgi:hypothetical protein
MSHLVLLDNEAVQALADPGHPKHTHVLAHVQVVAIRKRRGQMTTLGDPTAVRVEAGWDRNSPASAFLNHLRVTDFSLDAVSANRAAALCREERVSVADAHIGAVIQSAPATQLTILTRFPWVQQF